MKDSDSIKEVQEAEAQAKQMLEKSISSREGVLTKARNDAQRILAKAEEDAQTMRLESSKKIDREAGAIRETIMAKAEKEVAAISKRKLNKQKEKKAIAEAVHTVLK